MKVGFGLAFHILLPSVDSFRTWALSMLALFRILIGDLDLNQIMELPQTTLAVILFIAQVIISSILLLNLLIGK